MNTVSQTIEYIEIFAKKEAQGLDSTQGEWDKAADAIRRASTVLPPLSVFANC